MTNGTDPRDVAAETEELELDDAFAHMGRLIDELQGAENEQVRDKVFELLDWIDGFHREAVARIVGLLPHEALQALHEDPVVARLLETYSEEDEEEEEVVEDVATSLEEALDEIRPRAAS